MFTGIVETTGSVRFLRPQSGGARLGLDLRTLAEPPSSGASLAVNGACLTVASSDPPHCEFDLSAETVAQTNLGTLRPGDAVNIEQSLRVGDRLDGHFVQGHVDGMGRVASKEPEARGHKLWVQSPRALMPYMVPKGSVAVDGISLTLVDVLEDRFSVVIIPTTLQWTNLGQRRAGDVVNIETDLLARVAVRQIGLMTGAGRGEPETASGIAQYGGEEAPTGVTLALLQRAGFL